MVSKEISMRKSMFILAAMIFIPQIVFSQGMYLGDRSTSVYDSIPNGYRVFPLPIDSYQLKGISRENHRVDVFATYNKQGKISALLAELKSAQKIPALGSIPLVFKTDADDEFITVLLLQNIKVLYTPGISAQASDFAWSEYKQTNGSGASNGEEKAAASNIAIARLLLTPKEAQLAAYAVATNMKFTLVIRGGSDIEEKSLEPIDVNAFLKEKK